MKTRVIKINKGNGRYAVVINGKLVRKNRRARVFTKDGASEYVEKLKTIQTINEAVGFTAYGFFIAGMIMNAIGLKMVYTMALAGLVIGATSLIESKYI